MADNYRFRMRSPEQVRSTVEEMPGMLGGQISDFSSC